MNSESNAFHTLSEPNSRCNVRIDYDIDYDYCDSGHDVLPPPVVVYTKVHRLTPYGMLYLHLVIIRMLLVSNLWMLWRTCPP